MDFLAAFGSILLIFLAGAEVDHDVLREKLKERAQSHAVLPAFIPGLALAPIFHAPFELQRRFRVVAFALLTPFFFIKGGHERVARPRLDARRTPCTLSVAGDRVTW